MHLLYFGSFEGILYPYVKYNIIADGIISSESDFIFHLLTSVNPDDYDGSLSAASRYKTGARAIPEHIATLFHTLEARDMIVKHFREIVVGYIERGRCNQLIGDYINIVKQDTTIDDYFKNELLSEAHLETLPEFLADLLIYSVSVDPNEKDKTYPVENYNLPAENDWFTGRLAELKAIKDNFAEGCRIQILYGMGGMGKSQIALRFAYDHYRSYSLIHWVNAHTSESVIDCYRDLLKSKGLLIENESKSEVAHKYTSFMESHSDWLIVYDGCDYYKDEDFSQFVKEYLPKNPATGNILITTRNNRPIGKAKRIEIVTLTKAEAADFLMQRTELENLESAEGLAIRLGYFPLALELAGAYIRATPGVDCALYLSLLEKSFRILSEKTELTDYDDTLEDVIMLTLDRVKKDCCDDEISSIIPELLHLCSYCAPDHIDLKAFGYLFSKKLGGEIGLSENDIDKYGQDYIQLIHNINDICADDLKCNHLARLLLKYALMKANDEGYLFMHELQQEVIRSCLFREKIAPFVYVAFYNYCNQQKTFGRSYYYCMSHISSAINNMTIEAKKAGATKDRIIELNLSNSVQKIFTAVDKYRVVIMERASDAEMEAAHNAVWKSVVETTSIINEIADQDVPLHLLTTSIEGFNHALSLFALTNVFPSALAFARFSLITVFKAVKQHGISSVIDADSKDAKQDEDYHRGFLGDLFKDLGYCMSMCYFKGCYSEHIVPFLVNLPELLDPYAERAGWDESTLLEYKGIMEAYIKKDPFLLPERIQNAVSIKYRKSFSDIAKEAIKQISIDQ